MADYLKTIWVILPTLLTIHQSEFRLKCCNFLSREVAYSTTKFASQRGSGTHRPLEYTFIFQLYSTEPIHSWAQNSHIFLLLGYFCSKPLSSYLNEPKTCRKSVHCSAEPSYSLLNFNAREFFKKHQVKVLHQGKFFQEL